MGNGDADKPQEEPGVREKLEQVKAEVAELGGWEAIKSGEWLSPLIRKAFRNYYERANAEYFRKKYSGKTTEFIADRLVSVASRNAAILGVVVGAAVSTDEIVAIVTGGEGGAGLPANVAIAVTAVSGEAILLIRFQLQLVAQLARLYGTPLDPDDPEDILTILAFAAGGSVAEAAGKVGMKIGGATTEKLVRHYVSKEVLEGLKSVGKKLGVKILQRTILKYALPFVSMGIGSGWNYTATRSVGKIARRHLLSRLAADAATPQALPESAGVRPESP